MIESTEITIAAEEIDTNEVPIPPKIVVENFVETFTAFADACHKNAVAHGWWEGGFDGRNIPEVLLLIKSEALEAFEEWRGADSDPKKICYVGEKSKPEGIPVEIADIVIRCFDNMVALTAHTGSLDIVRVIANNVLFALKHEIHVATNVGEALDDIVDEVTRARRAWERGKGDQRNIDLALAMAPIVSRCFLFTRFHGIDLAEAILIKHVFNKSRPYRHGNKRA